MDFTTFTQEFRKLRDEGQIKSLRRGNTGVGHTLEQRLGLTENAFALPDLGVAELKAHRDGGSNSLITLFTYDRKVWKMPQPQAIATFGTEIDERINFYTTLTANQPVGELVALVTPDHVRIISMQGEVIAEWPMNVIAAQFTRKFPALVLVTASSDTVDGSEYFRYHSAALLHGTSEEQLYECLSKGWVKIDVRMHRANGKVRNHGTAFRIAERHLARLFKERDEI